MKSLLEYVKTQAKLSGRQLLSYDTLAEFPEKQVKELESKGVLFQIKDAEGIICTECDQECWKPVETRIKDGKAIGVIYCTDDDSGGLVEVELVRLQQWEIVKEKLFKPEKGDNKPEIIDIDMELFSEGPSKNLLTMLILTPKGVTGTSQDVRNLRETLRDGKGDEYKMIANHISKVRKKNIVRVDTKKITLKVKE